MMRKSGVSCFHVVVCLLAAFLLGSCQGDQGKSTGGPAAVVGAPGAVGSYVLVWSDEFNSGLAPSLLNWRIETGYGTNGWGNDEWQLYTSSPSNVYIQNGDLVIAAQCPTRVCGKRDGSITSARITTKGKFAVKYGKIQARIRPPSGQGMWPAFWMLGSNIDSVGWPQSGEIDAMEMHYQFSNVKTTHAAAHWWDESLATPAHTFTSASKTFSAPLTNDYHIFEVDWDETRIVGKIDDIVYYVQPIDSAKMTEFFNSFNLLLNLAVGGTLGGNTITAVWPQEMHVDWVRVYQKVQPSVRGIYSETYDVGSQNYIRIINTAEWGGNDVKNNPFSNAVIPFDGSNVLQADYSLAGPGWGGMVFMLKHDDWSRFTHLNFSLDASAMTAFADLEVKIEDARGGGSAKSVMLSSYAPVISGNWARYSIPLADFAGVDFSNVTYLGFYNPISGGNIKLAGTLYFDDLNLTTAPCNAPGSITFDAATYPSNRSGATVRITDLCSANRLGLVTLFNGADTIVAGVPIDSAGQGSVLVAFGPTNDATQTISVAGGTTLTAQYTDGSGLVRTASASITAAAGLVGDINNDGYVYVYANNQAIQDLTWGAQPAGDYLIDAWGSGTVITDPYTTDPDFGRVLSMVPGTLWGSSNAVVAFISMVPGNIANYSTLNFKVKGLPAGSIDVMFSTAGPPELRKTFLLSAVGTAIPATTGWYNVTIPLSNYPDLISYTDMAFIVPGGSFLLTDVNFQ